MSSRILALKIKTPRWDYIIIINIMFPARWNLVVTGFGSSQFIISFLKLIQATKNYVTPKAGLMLVACLTFSYLLMVEIIWRPYQVESGKKTDARR